MNSNSFSLITLLALVRKWRLPVLYVFLAAAIISSVISLLIPNKFQSTAVFYATNPRSSDPEWIFSGEEKIEVNMSTITRDIDRLITIGESRGLAESVIRKFDLFSDYGLDTTDRAMSMHYALEEYKDHFRIAHNSRDAIEVSFLHRDNQKAADIANAIVARIDQKSQELTRENRQRVLALHEKRFKLVDQEFALLRDSLQQSRYQHNLTSQDRQSRELAAAISDAETQLTLAQGMLAMYTKSLPPTDPKIKDLKAEINGQRAVLNSLINASRPEALNVDYLTRSADGVIELLQVREELLKRYGKAKLAYDDAQIAYDSQVSNLYIVQKAVPSMRKAKPIRWLIVVSTTLVSVFLCLVLISMYEFYRTETRKVMA